MKKLIYIIPILTFLINGCLNYTQVTTLKTDGSGEMFVHYWMKFNNELDSLLINRLGIFQPDSIQHEFEAPFISIENTEVYKDFTDSTIHGKIELKFSHIDSLNKSKPFFGADFNFRNESEDVKIFSQYIQPIATGFGFEKSSFKIRYVYYIPGEIIEHNAIDLSRNKLTWEFNLDEIGGGKKIYARFIPYKLKETPNWIYYSSLFVLLIVLVFLFMRRRT